MLMLIVGHLLAFFQQWKSVQAPNSSPWLGDGFRRICRWIVRFAWCLPVYILHRLLSDMPVIVGIATSRSFVYHIWLVCWLYYWARPLRLPYMAVPALPTKNKTNDCYVSFFDALVWTYLSCGHHCSRTHCEVTPMAILRPSIIWIKIERFFFEPCVNRQWPPHM